MLTPNFQNFIEDLTNFIERVDSSHLTHDQSSISTIDLSLHISQLEALKVEEMFILHPFSPNTVNCCQLDEQRDSKSSKKGSL